ncbi:MAG TPA: hydroxymethylbilane synthase [Candidatus Udaeobacter sp.]|nr:hydroxymethylbilane synthase [Candidatus Udaeobacter sp.]
MIAKITLGTRGSELARAQTLLVEKAIRRAQPDVTVETKIIVTRGDNAKNVDVQAGRKGLFTAEIERALLDGDVDVAVHSAKDLPSEAMSGAQIAAVLPRASVNDVLISKHAGGLSSTPCGATVATGSVRRQRQLHWKRADLKVVDLRGNVPTRLRKLAQNQWDGIVLAHAGLERLGFSATQTKIDFEGGQFFLEILPCEIFLPAGGQGIIALQIRSDDQSTNALLQSANDLETLLCLQAEREFLVRLHGDCNFPVGVHATIKNGRMKLHAQLFEGESPTPRQAEVEGASDEGYQLAAELLRKIGQD